MYAFRSAFEARDARKKMDLRDECGERIIAGRRASPNAAISEPVLRREVAIDLESLMNTVALESTIDLEASEYVRRSILNFGFPDLTHRTIDENSLDEIGDEIKTVLCQFEPRLLPESVRVARDALMRQAELKVRFVVNAELTCNPVNVPVEFLAEVELDTAKIVVSRL
jgi:type VI secretion system protein ImpF